MKIKRKGPGPARGLMPALDHLYRLDEQLRSDRASKLEDLRERDHAIGKSLSQAEDRQCLMHWLEEVNPPDGNKAPRWLSEAHAALIMRLAAILFGLLAMSGFLLASDRALVNVFLLLALFVFFPLATSLIAAWAIIRSLRGSTVSVFPLNPARFVIRYALPDWRYLQESSAVVRLLLFKYGQEFGALFAVGAMISFVGLLAFNDFSFVWGSTFAFSDAMVTRFAAILALPWSALLPSATVSPEIIADTRYYATQLDLGQISAESRRAWWPFLFMCLSLYSLLPRLLLWLLSTRAYRNEVSRAFLSMPGASSVLTRMRTPVVSTQAADEDHVDARVQPVVCEAGTVLLEWAGAMALASGLIEVEDSFQAGLGSPADDLDAIEGINRLQPSHLLVAVKAWEPPMADLADVLAEVHGVSRCSLQLVSLPGRELGEASLRDWQAFASALPFAATALAPLGGQ